MAKKKPTTAESEAMERSRITIAVASGLMRYCPMCERWVSLRETECKLCGMPTERAAK